MGARRRGFRRSGGSSGRRCDGDELRRVPETHAYPRAVLFKVRWRDLVETVVQFWSGSAEGQEAGDRACVVAMGGSEDGRPIKAWWLPSVVHRAPVVVRDEAPTERMVLEGHC